MKALHIAVALAAVSLHAQESQPIRRLSDRVARGTLSDQRQIVRGDSGRWNDKPTLQHAPPIERKPRSVSLDDWAEQIADRKPEAAAGDDNWLVFRTRQLDDNDRVWVESIERRGNEFTVTMSEAIWQGSYFKTFTYYEVTAVNLGKLAPGDYTVKWIIKPLAFTQLEKPREAQRDYQANWPIDEQPGAGEPVELKAAFSVR